MLGILFVASVALNFCTSIKPLRNTTSNSALWGVSSNSRSNASRVKANQSAQVDYPKGDRMDPKTIMRLRRQRRKQDQPDRMDRLNKLGHDLHDMVHGMTDNLESSERAEVLESHTGQPAKTVNVSNSPAKVSSPKEHTLRKQFRGDMEPKFGNHTNGTNTPKPNGGLEPLAPSENTSDEAKIANHTNVTNPPEPNLTDPNAVLSKQLNPPTVNGVAYPPTWALPNAVCFNHTGRRCSPDKPCWNSAQCSEGKWCVCTHSENCAVGSNAACVKSPNKWLGVKLRISPKAAPVSYFAMATDEASPPYMVNVWPDEKHQEASWDLLVEPDAVSVLLATTWARDHWHGRFLDLNESASFAVQQRQPFDALQAAFNLVLMPEASVAFRHIRTGRYLYFDKKARRLSTCASPDCPRGMAEFNVHPKPKTKDGSCVLCENPYRQALVDTFAYETSTFLRPFQCWGG